MADEGRPKTSSLPLGSDQLKRKRYARNSTLFMAAMALTWLATSLMQGPDAVTYEFNLVLAGLFAIAAIIWLLKWNRARGGSK